MRPMLLALTLLVTSSCGGGAANRVADIAGIVTSVSGRTDGVTVLVESDPSTPTAGQKASVAVTSATRITRRAPGGDVAATARELTPGVQVEVWFDGPVAMSYPIQAKALAVVIVR
jgi:acyl-coenzyme A thioesterase PaaI-like protein